VHLSVHVFLGSAQERGEDGGLEGVLLDNVVPYVCEFDVGVGHEFALGVINVDVSLETRGVVPGRWDPVHPRGDGVLYTKHVVFVATLARLGWVGKSGRGVLTRADRFA
jgi:hypothetical protein